MGSRLSNWSPPMCECATNPRSVMNYRPMMPLSKPIPSWHIPLQLLIYTTTTGFHIYMAPDLVHRHRPGRAGPTSGRVPRANRIGSAVHSLTTTMRLFYIDKRDVLWGHNRRENVFHHISIVWFQTLCRDTIKCRWGNCAHHA